MISVAEITTRIKRLPIFPEAPAKLGALLAQGNAGDGLAKVEGIRSRHRISEREIGERASGAGPPGPGARELGGKCYGRTRARSPGTQFGRVGFARKRVDLVQSRRFFVEVKGDLPANVVWFNHLFG